MDAIKLVTYAIFLLLVTFVMISVYVHNAVKYEKKINTMAENCRSAGGVCVQTKEECNRLNGIINDNYACENKKICCLTP